MNDSKEDRDELVAKWKEVLSEQKNNSALKRMLGYAWVEDKSIYFLCAIYTLAAIMVPVISVALPKVIIGYLTEGGFGIRYSKTGSYILHIRCYCILFKKNGFGLYISSYYNLTHRLYQRTGC